MLIEDAAWHWARRDQAPPSLVLGYGAVTEPTMRRALTIVATAMDAIRC